MGLPIFVAAILLTCGSLVAPSRMSAITYANALELSAEDLSDVRKLLTNLPGAFELFKNNFERTYSNADDEQKRFLNFAANIANAAKMASSNPLATFGVTQFSDLSSDEFKSFLSTVPKYVDASPPSGEVAQRRTMDAMGLPVRPEVLYDRESGSVLTPRVPVDYDDLPEIFKNKHNRMRLEKELKDKQTASGLPRDDDVDTSSVSTRRNFNPAANDLPEKLDWRDLGVVTPVKYQGACGACWAFSAAQNIESLWAIAGQPLTRLSEQQLTSCDRLNNGCEGGVIQAAYNWILRSNDGFIAKEEFYPYVNANTRVAPTCNNLGAGGGAKITSYVDIRLLETEIQKYVANVGPVAVSIEAYGWESYTGGIITSSNNLLTTHAVLVVGYDTTNDPPYWILKNTWSTQWGEKGYIRTQMGKNVCMITDNPSTSVVAQNFSLADLPQGDPARRANGANGIAASATMTAVIVALASLLFA